MVFCPLPPGSIARIRWAALLVFTLCPLARSRASAAGKASRQDYANGVYSMRMRGVAIGMAIIETATFTRQILALLPDDEYRKMQAALANNPKLGPVVRGRGGLR